MQKIMSKTTFTLKRKQFGFVGNMFGAKNWNNLKQTGTAVNLATKKEVGVNAQGKVLSGGYKAGQIAAGGAKALGSTALIAGGLAIGTGLAAKGVVNKASEQSDGSKMFSQVKKNNMATTYTLKRKTFAKMSERTLEDLHKIVASAPEGNTVRNAAQQELSRRTAITPFTPPPTNNQPPKASQTNMGATTTPKTKTSPGFGKRIINKWNNMSTLGKVGIGATAAVGVGLATNAILNNKKNKEQQQ